MPRNPEVAQAGVCRGPCRSNRAGRAPGEPWAGRHRGGTLPQRKDGGISVRELTAPRCGPAMSASDHEAVLLPVVGHQDDVAGGSPDEPRQPEGVVGARGGRLHGGHLVGFHTAQLRGRVQHADASQQRGVHLGAHRGRRAHSSHKDSLPHPSRTGAQGPLSPPWCWLKST